MVTPVKEEEDDDDDGEGVTEERKVHDYIFGRLNIDISTITTRQHM